ncbi:MAG: hypothetical protein NTY99_04000 [DPANN group archaeon]|nr:hypothetical protein [DPANN group archaeon]
MVLPSYILKGDDLEKAFEKMPIEKFRDLTKGRIYVSDNLRPAVNEVLREKYNTQLPKQMQIDAYAVLSIPVLEKNTISLSQFVDVPYKVEEITIVEAVPFGCEYLFHQASL